MSFRPTDAWDDPIEITCMGDGFAVRSAGPDRHVETADDLQLGCLPRPYVYGDACHHAQRGAETRSSDGAAMAGVQAGHLAVDDYPSTWGLPLAPDGDAPGGSFDVTR
jgi:hypothetical protein